MVSGRLKNGAAQLSDGSSIYVNALNSNLANVSAKVGGKTLDAAKAAYAQSLTAYTQTITAVYTERYTAKIQAGIDALQDYLNPSFTMTDFVNGSSEHIKRVQFVIMTDAIEVEAQDNSASETPSKEKGFFEKLLALFTGE